MTNKMGVTNLSKLVNSDAPRSVKPIMINDLSGKTYVVDTSPQLYQCMIAIRGKNNGKDMTTQNGTMSSHICGMFNRVFSFIIYGIQTVWVFDGEPPDMKKAVLHERRKVRRSAQKLLDTGSFVDDLQKVKLAKKAVTINKKIVDDVKELFELLGVPYIQAISEAEAQCAALSISGKVDGVITNDWDALTFGSLRLIKNFNTRNTQTMNQIDLNNVLNELNLTYSQFVDICLLLGTDYCPGIRGISGTSLYNELVKQETVQRVVNKLIKVNKQAVAAGKKPPYTVPSNFLKKYQLAKEYYDNVDIVDPADPTIRMFWRKPNRDQLISFLCGKFELDANSVQKKVDIIMAIYRKFEEYGNLSSSYYKTVVRYVNSNNKHNKYGFNCKAYHE